MTKRIGGLRVDWDMRDWDWDWEDRVVGAFADALKGCGDDGTPIVAFDEYGRELKILGVGAEGGRVHIIVSAISPGGTA